MRKIFKLAPTVRWPLTDDIMAEYTFMYFSKRLSVLSVQLNAVVLWLTILDVALWVKAKIRTRFCGPMRVKFPSWHLLCTCCLRQSWTHNLEVTLAITVGQTSTKTYKGGLCVCVCSCSICGGTSQTSQKPLFLSYLLLGCHIFRCGLKQQTNRASIHSSIERREGGREGGVTDAVLVKRWRCKRLMNC